VQFVHDTSISPETLWREFAHEHATVPVLAQRHAISERTVRRRLDDHKLLTIAPAPRTMVAVMDATRIGPTWILAVRDPNAGETVYAHECEHESTFEYQMARKELAAQGFFFSGIVTDGRFVDVPRFFSGIPLQMCHFHQIQIVIRYLTLKPKTQAGIELLDLVRTLPRTDEASFTDAFTLWLKTHRTFLQEKTINPETGRFQWTHRRMRQARDSITAHLPILFTYQKYPELHMPNTTNSLDGKFKKGKVAIGVHAGLTHARQIKLMLSLLSERE
jgi:hypothetical protein